MYAIIGTVIGLCFFILPLWAYRRGLKDGLALQQGKPIEPIRNPVQAVQRHTEQKKTQAANDKVTEGLANLLAYDGTPQEVKHGTD